MAPSKKKPVYWERKESYYVFQRMYAEKYGEIFPRISFNLDDQGSRVWPRTKEHSMAYSRFEPVRRDFCGPDFTFIHWPSSKIESSEDTFRKILKAGESEAASDKVAWFGNTRSPGHIMPERVTRPKLVDHFGAKYPERFDFFHAGAGAKSKIYMSLEDMTSKYGVLLDIGGAGWSGRLKFLLFSNRPVLVVDRVYVDYFYEDLKPFEHYVPVKSDLSDLLESHDWIRDNPEKARRIAENAREFAVKNFDRDAVLQRLRFALLNCVQAEQDSRKL